MKVLTCPINGPRNIDEFIYGGEVKDMPDPAQTSDEAWADYVFFHDNTVKVVKEWWCHAPSDYWFIAERHTASDEITRTYDPSELFASRTVHASLESES
jgi:sarcosine oxidase subunit delta